MGSHRFLQVNLHHCAGASAALIRRFASEKLDAALIQEPWVHNKIKGLNLKSTKVICDNTVSNPRSAILINNTLNYLPLNNHITKDCVAVIIKVKGESGFGDIVIASAYFPGDDLNEPPPAEVKSLISFCISQDLPYIIGCDANAHHSSWGSTNINKRGESLFAYLLNMDAVVINEGNKPTFSFNGRDEVLDITFCRGNSHPH